MRALLLTQADTRAELEQDFALWQQFHGQAPDLIVGPDDLEYECDRAGEDGSDSTFRGIRVISFVELREIYRESFPGYDASIEDDGDSEHGGEG